MFSCSERPTLHFLQVRKTYEIFRIAVVAAQSLVLVAITPTGHTQIADPANLLGFSGRRKPISCGKRQPAASRTQAL